MDKAQTQFYSAALIAISFAILALGMGLLSQKNFFKTTLPMHLSVSEPGVLGFNVSESLEFGAIPPGAGGRKVVFITNNFNSEKTMFLRAYGGIASWISVSQNGVSVRPGQTLNVSVVALVPPYAAKGDYYGILEITLG
ncbi:MAG: hypothetical protein QXR53_02945 [Candidatus Norongarragalinales archaeon]